MTLPPGETRQFRRLRLRYPAQVTHLHAGRRGKPLLAVMPWELYDAIAETLKVMGDKELRALPGKSIEEMDKGEAIPWDETKRELGL